MHARRDGRRRSLVPARRDRSGALRHALHRRPVAGSPLAAAARHRPRAGQRRRDLAGLARHRPTNGGSPRLAVARRPRLWLIGWDSLPGRRPARPRRFGRARCTSSRASCSSCRRGRTARDSCTSSRSPAGTARAFGPGHVHRVVNPSAAVATSIHVYSPPLVGMDFYAGRCRRRARRARTASPRSSARSGPRRAAMTSGIDELLAAARARLHRVSPSEAAAAVDARRTARRHSAGVATARRGRDPRRAADRAQPPRVAARSDERRAHPRGGRPRRRGDRGVLGGLLVEPRGREPAGPGAAPRHRPGRRFPGVARRGTARSRRSTELPQATARLTNAAAAGESGPGDGRGGPDG